MDARKKNIFSLLVRGNGQQQTPPVNIGIDIVSGDPERDRHLMLMDKNGILVQFPINLVHCNDLRVKNGKVYMSESMYKSWFTHLLDQEMTAMDLAFRQNFPLIISNAERILKNPAYRRLRFPYLSSGIGWFASTSYSLGALLECWLEDDTLMVEKNRYMIRIYGSALSGINRYEAYCTETRKIINSGDRQSDWKPYFDIFTALAQKSNEMNKSNLITAKCLFRELNIELPC